MCILREMREDTGTTLRGAPQNRIDGCFDALDGRCALILYVTAGHPTIAQSAEIVHAVAESADIIEIGIPFSDPVADGPVIQESSQAALHQGTNVSDCLHLVRELRARSETPVVFLTYYNPVLHYGIERFAVECASAGVDGVIAADVPPEEAALLRDALTDKAIHVIPLLAPTSTDSRLENACSHAGGFVYCVSRTGVTGIQEAMTSDLPVFLERVREHTDLPRAVGFGISQPAHAAMVAELAEGVIVGSALVDLISRTAPSKIDPVIRGFAADLSRAMGR
jgi:tryptophan synthase alpha chain